MIGIQNSKKTSNINFVLNKTVQLPVSFIIGLSFISGTLTGGFLTLSLKNK